MEILRLPLVIAAVVVVLRVIFERLGVPESVNFLLSVAFLHTIAIPIYIAIRLARDPRTSRPYLTLLKLIAVYAVLTRIMILPVYWLARIFEWEQSRFGGLWGPDVNAFVGFIGVPIGTALVWIVNSVVVGGAIGALVLRLMRRPVAVTP